MSRVGKNQPLNALCHLRFVEIDQQPKRNIEQFHVTQQLRFVNGENLFDSLCLHENAIFNEDIKSQRFLARESFVFDDDKPLMFDCQTS